MICAKSSTSRLGTSAAGEFLHELEEKMEVARLQMNVYKCLSNMRNSPDVEAAKNKLDSELLDITSVSGPNLVYGFLGVFFQFS